MDYTKKKKSKSSKSSANNSTTPTINKKRTPIVNRAMCTGIYAKMRQMSGYDKNKSYRDLFNHTCSVVLTNNNVTSPSPEDWVLAAAHVWAAHWPTVNKQGF